MRVLYPAKVNSPETTLAASIGKDIFVNGGFERGDLTGWGASGDATIASFTGQDGDFCARIYAEGADVSSITQNVDLTGIGEITFKYYHVSATGLGVFHVYIDEDEVFFNNWDTSEEWGIITVDTSEYSGVVPITFRIDLWGETGITYAYIDSITQTFLVPGGGFGVYDEGFSNELPPWTQYPTGSENCYSGQMWAYWKEVPDYTAACVITAYYITNPAFAYIEQTLDFTDKKTLQFRKCVDDNSMGASGEFYVEIGGVKVYSKTTPDGDFQYPENWSLLQIDVSEITGEKTLRFACVNTTQYNCTRVGIDEVTLIPTISDFTTIPVTELNVFPDAPNLCVITDESNVEVVKYRGKSATSGEGYLTDCVRGFYGEACEWNAGASCGRNFSSYDYMGISENVEDITVINGVAGEDINEHDICYLAPDSKWYKTDATVESKIINQLGAAITGASADTNILIQITGIVRNDAWSFTPSSKVYVSNTAGGASSNAGTYTRKIGVATASNALYLNPFDGEPTMIGIQIFNDNINYLIVGVPISFAAQIQTQYSIVAYDWDFDDGSPHATDLSPVHTYAASGEYDVHLTATDSASNTWEAHYTINIHERPLTVLQGAYCHEQPIRLVSSMVDSEKPQFPDDNLGVIISLSSTSVTFINDV